jgi:LAS superfamily LD-carboxypeptidase LdcB
MKSLLVLLVLAVCFSVSAQTLQDTARGHQGATQRAPDSLSVNPGLSSQLQAQKIKINNKEIDYATSIKLALGMMAFIALILFTTQSWNPGGVNQ